MYSRLFLRVFGCGVSSGTNIESLAFRIFKAKLAFQKLRISVKHNTEKTSIATLILLLYALSELAASNELVFTSYR